MANKKKNKNNSISAQDILGGAFLTRKWTVKHLPFLLFLAFLAIVYIGNSFYAEKNIRKIERLQKKVKVQRYDYITNKSKLMQSSRQSKVAKNLRNKGIKESTVPPNKIFVKEE